MYNQVIFIALIRNGLNFRLYAYLPATGKIYDDINYAEEIVKSTGHIWLLGRIT